MNASLHNQGFTIIELIVAMGVFAVVSTIAVGSLLALIGNNEQLQNEQSVMTNLAFLVDSMSREIRTGTNYYCTSFASLTAAGPNNIFNNSNNPDAILGTDTRDCAGPTGSHAVHGISIIEAGDSITGVGSDRITYFFNADTGEILRRVGGDTAESIGSSDIYINEMRFTVTGSEGLDVSGGSDSIQPAVTIFINASDRNDPAAKEFYLQTTITQRILDL
jgi:prepilin-type N-terminal cleavage/methylation domain-containing protein